MKPKTHAYHIYSGHVRIANYLYHQLIKRNLTYLTSQIAPQEMTPRGERRHFITKACSTALGCQQSNFM